MIINQGTGSGVENLKAELATQDDLIAQINAALDNKMGQATLSQVNLESDETPQ